MTEMGGLLKILQVSFMFLVSPIAEFLYIIAMIKHLTFAHSSKSDRKILFRKNESKKEK